jgi:hypothetical protein
MYDLTVRLPAPVDIGAGESDVIVFAGCKSTIDSGCLAVFNDHGPVAQFAAGAWLTAMRLNIADVWAIEEGTMFGPRSVAS